MDAEVWRALWMPVMVGLLAVGLVYGLACAIWAALKEHRERREIIQSIRSRGRLVRIPDSPEGRQRFELVADEASPAKVDLAAVERRAEPRVGAREQYSRAADEALAAYPRVRRAAGAVRPDQPTSRPEGPAPQPPPTGRGSA